MTSNDLQRYRDSALLFFNRCDRPVFTGELAVYVSLNLEQTIELLEDLVESKHVRCLTALEKKQLDMHSASEAFVLLTKAVPKLAYR
jgi:hypothetical protein